MLRKVSVPGSVAKVAQDHAVVATTDEHLLLKTGAGLVEMMTDAHKDHVTIADAVVTMSETTDDVADLEMRTPAAANPECHAVLNGVKTVIARPHAHDLEAHTTLANVL